jgi:glycyl-tRNA synthetase
MEIEYFTSPERAPEDHKAWKEACMNFLTSKIGISEENVRFRDHDENELAHYADACVDIEYKFPMGW